MNKGTLYSILLHGLLLLYLTFGLPLSFDKPKLVDHVVVELLPISKVTNAKPIKPKAKPAAPIKKKPKKKKPPPEPKKEIVKKIKKKVEKKIKVAIPKKHKEPKPKPKKNIKPPQPTKKAALKDLTKHKIVKKPEKKIEIDPFDALTDRLEKIDITKPKYNPDQPMTVSEKDALQERITDLIHGNHHVLSGAKNAQKIYTKLFISVDKSCIIKGVEVGDTEATTNIASTGAMGAVENQAIRAVYAADFKGNLSNRECEYIFAESGIAAHFYPDL